MTGGRSSLTVPITLLMMALASIFQATPFAISIGQTSLLLFLGLSLVVAGSVRNFPVLVFLGLVLTMLKPQVGVFVLVYAMVDPRMRLVAFLALVLLGVLTLPALWVSGVTGTVSGFLASLANYNSAEAVASLPEHLVGVQKLLSVAGLPASLGLLVLAALAALTAAGLAGVSGSRFLVLSIVLAVLFGGLHTYDLTIVLCLTPFLRLIGPLFWAALVAFALLIRPANLAAIISAGPLDSSIFQGSFHATVGLLLLAAVGLAGIAKPGPRPDDRT